MNLEPSGNQGAVINLDEEVKLSLSRREWDLLQQILLVFMFNVMEKLNALPASVFNFDDDEQRIVTAMHVMGVLFPNTPYNRLAAPRDTDRITLELFRREIIEIQRACDVVLSRSLQYEVRGELEDFAQHKLPPKGDAWHRLLERVCGLMVDIRDELGLPDMSSDLAELGFAVPPMEPAKSL